MSFLDEVPWDADGLITAVAQDASSGRILMVAWMNREALQQTVERSVETFEVRAAQTLLEALGRP